MALRLAVLLFGAWRFGDESANPQVIGGFGQRRPLFFEHGELFAGALEALGDVAEASLDE